MPDAALAGVREQFAAANVPPDRAQPLFDAHMAALKTAVDATRQAATEHWQSTQREWQDQLRADKDIGGDKLDKSIQAIRGGAKNLLGDQAAKDLFTALNLTGAGNNPAIVKAMHKAFATHAAATSVGGRPTGTGGKSAAEVMYPTQAALGNAQSA